MVHAHMCDIVQGSVLPSECIYYKRSVSQIISRMMHKIAALIMMQY